MALPGISRWKNRVALVTGAGAGIGAYVAQQLAKHGMIVVGCARNVAPIDNLSKECVSLGYEGKLHSVKCDLTKENEIEEMFAWIKTNHGGVDVCVNNAGFTTMTTLLKIKATEMREMVDTNVVALVLCSNLSIASMQERNVDGHIFNISSILGHLTMGFMHFYSGTKFAVKAITEGLRKELDAQGSKIKVTQISPGRVETNFLQRALGGDKEKAKGIYAAAKSLEAADVGNALLHALSAPEHVQVYDIIMQPMSVSQVHTYYK